MFHTCCSDADCTQPSKHNYDELFREWREPKQTSDNTAVEQTANIFHIWFSHRPEIGPNFELVFSKPQIFNTLTFCMEVFKCVSWYKREVMK